MEVNINIRINDDVPEQYKEIVMADVMSKIQSDIENGCNQGELISEFEGDDGEDFYFRGWWKKQTIEE